MAGKKKQTNPINELGVNLRQMFEELFGECEETDDTYRATVTHLGVMGSDAVVEVALEQGVSEEVLYGVLHFVTTLADEIPEEALADVIIAMNALNNLISAGAFPSFGNFCYYEPLNQIYLSYRMPVNLLRIDAEYDNIRYYLGCLYEQLDLLKDYIVFTVNTPGGMTIQDYMDYLDEVSDLDDIEERSGIFREQFDELIREAGADPDAIYAQDED